MPGPRQHPDHPVAGDCAGFDVLSAQVSFYDVADPDNILESFALDPNVNVTGVSIAGGQLAGMDTDFFDYFVPPPSLTIAGGGTYSFSLLLYGGNLAQLISPTRMDNRPAAASSGPRRRLRHSADPAVGTSRPPFPSPRPTC